MPRECTRSPVISPKLRPRSPHYLKRFRACRCPIYLEKSELSATRLPNRAMAREPSPILKEIHHGTLGARGYVGPGESQRHHRQGRGARKDDQTGDSRHAESTAASEDAGGDRDRRPASARKEAEGESGKIRRLGSQGRTGGD